MVPLPNDLWIRSPKRPDYAVCFDEGDHLFLWKCKEDGDTWIGVRKLHREELWKCLKIPELASVKHIVNKRLDRY
jgi:hypothetical protein